MLTRLLAHAHSQGSLVGRVRRRAERPCAPGCSVEGLQALDAELARRAGEAGRLRFEMGRGLDLLEQSGGHHALGFSSIEAYALERCERSGSWTQKARGLARRLATIELPDDEAMSPQRAWERELARMRAEAEERCESHFRHSPEPRPHVEPLLWPEQPEAIDRQQRELSRELVGREVAFGRVLDAFFSADGWRRLGYATAAQYARERLGTSLSSVKAKRRLVKRLAKLRFLADAVDRGQLGLRSGATGRRGCHRHHG